MTITQKLIKLNADHDHERYITTQEFKKLTSEIFAIRLANEEVTSNKSKDVLDENELKKITDIWLKPFY